MIIYLLLLLFFLTTKMDEKSKINVSIRTLGGRSHWMIWFNIARLNFNPTFAVYSSKCIMKPSRVYPSEKGGISDLGQIF